MNRRVKMSIIVGVIVLVFVGGYFLSKKVVDDSYSSESLVRDEIVKEKLEGEGV